MKLEPGVRPPQLGTQLTANETETRYLGKNEAVGNVTKHHIVIREKKRPIRVK